VIKQLEHGAHFYVTTIVASEKNVLRRKGLYCYTQLHKGIYDERVKGVLRPSNA